MGCYNVSGGLSGLDISSGNDVILIPLTGSTTYKSKLEIDVILCSNEGASQFFSPSFLPIRGKYDEYGSIENIIRDDNVKLIEDYFGISIENFLHHLNRQSFDEYDFDFKNDKVKEEFQKTGWMFEHASIYDSMVADIMQRHKAEKDMELSKETLIRLGFKVIDEDTNDERFDICLTHEYFDGLKVHSDGRFSHVFDGNKGRQSIFDVGGLTEYLSENDYPTLDISSINGKSVYELMLRDDLERKLEGERKLEKYNLYDENKKLNMDAIAELTKNGDFYLLSHMISDKMRMFTAIGHNQHLFKFLNENTIMELTKLIYFNVIMYRCNKLYMPSVGGSQITGESTQLKLAELSSEILKKRMQSEYYWEEI